MKRSKGSLRMAERIKKIILSILPEEKKNLIPCVVFGSLIITLGMANVWKWVV